MTARLGLNAKCYRNTGTYGTPTWTEMKNIRDATLGDQMSEADVTRRASGGFRETEPTIRELSFDYDAVNIESDTEVAAVLTAYAARTAIELAIMDGDIVTAGSKGVRASFKVFKRERSEELENAQMLAFSFKPCQSANAPAEMTIS
jgi:hypothetical protein